MSNKVGMYIMASVTVRCSTSDPDATDGYFRLQSTTEGRVAGLLFSLSCPQRRFAQLFTFLSML